MQGNIFQHPSLVEFMYLISILIEILKDVFSTFLNGSFIMTKTTMLPIHIPAVKNI